MTDRFNTIAGWTLFAGIVALGSSIASGLYFQADKPHPPHEPGYKIEGVVDITEPEEPDLGTLFASGDAAAGGADFAARCSTCHTVEQGGATLQGPNLFGVVGKPIGKHAAGFAYSGDLAEHGGEWSYENLDAWLASPKRFAPGTKMSFAGLSDPQARANIILYLRDNGGGPALPEPVAAAAPEGAEGADAAAGPEEAPGQEAAGAVASEQPEEDAPSAAQPGSN
jgi:cytochrome c